MTLLLKSPTQTVNYIQLGAKLIAKDGVTQSSNSSTQHVRPFGSSIEGENEDAGYTGHKFDTDLGLSYMQARYYDPVIGRFYSNDPIGFRDIHSFNRYAYANNNPYKYIDPDGQASLNVNVELEGKLGSFLSSGLSRLGYNELNASGGTLSFGLAVSFPFFDDAIFDAGIVASGGATDISVDPNTNFVSLPGLKVGANLVASEGSVSDLAGTSYLVKGQSNIGKKASGLIVDGLEKAGLPKSLTKPLRKAAGSLLGLIVSGGITGNAETGQIQGVELGLAKGLNAGVSGDVSKSVVCTVRTGCSN